MSAFGQCDQCDSNDWAPVGRRGEWLQCGTCCAIRQASRVRVHHVVPNVNPAARSAKFTHQIVVRVDDALYEALQEDAKDYGRTIAQSARHAMTRHLGVTSWKGTKP